MNKAFDKLLKELNEKYGSGYVAKDVWGYTYIYKTKPYYHPTKEGWCGDEEFYEPGYWEGDRLVPESCEGKINKAYQEQYGESAPAGKEGIWSF